MTGAALRARSALVLLLSMPAVVWTGALLAGTPSLILLCAVTPAIVFAAAILALQRGSGRSWQALAFSLAWGAVVAAWLSTTGNEIARPWLDELWNGDDRVLTALVVAPLLEEAAKALGLLLLLWFGRLGLRNARDGMVCGALVGIGFVFTENLLYLGLSVLQGGEPALLRALYLRGALGAATHAAFTACAGAGLGWYAGGEAHNASRRLAPVLGFLFAHSQHLAWNALAAPAIAGALCGAENGVCRDVPSSFAVYGEATLITLAFLAPGLAALGVAWRNRSPSAERS